MEVSQHEERSSDLTGHASKQTSTAVAQVMTAYEQMCMYTML